MKGFFLLSMGVANALTGAELWKQYQANPYNHPQMPNCSYAGYRTGMAAIPDVAQVNKVTDFGAKADGTTDNTEAFRKAVEDAKAKGGGAILVPAGTYKVDGMIRLNGSKVVLRGEGRDKTILDFGKGLEDFAGKNLDPRNIKSWSWSGGLIWMGPTDDVFGADDKLDLEDWDTDKDGFKANQEWEYWRPGKDLSAVTGAGKRGDFNVTVASGAGLAAGMMVMMTWELSADLSFAKHVGGHALLEAYLEQNKAAFTWIAPPEYKQFQWPVQIKSIAGSTVTLVQPLRVDIRPEWKVAFRELGNHISETGVEKMTLKMHAPVNNHNTYTGWNGVYINRAYNCWVRDLHIIESHNPIILAAAKNVTVTDIVEDRTVKTHHLIACRVNSHDNLFQNFTFNGPKVRHGINTEWFSSGNVWQKGKMVNSGTFDSHRAMSFDFIRTEIEVANGLESLPGGAGEAGPFLGRRSVHWNVKYVAPAPPNDVKPDPGQYIYQPNLHTMAALVGMQGVARSTSGPEAMPSGNMDVLEADSGKVPDPVNLYEAQLDLRRMIEGVSIEARNARGLAKAPVLRLGRSGRGSAWTMEVSVPGGDGDVINLQGRVRPAKAPMDADTGISTGYHDTGRAMPQQE